MDKPELIESELDPDPFRQFNVWMDYAVSQEMVEPTAMTVSTVDSSGQPNARMVLLKQVDSRGFVFYTNYNSRKGGEIANNAAVSLLLYWGPLERQIRILGTAEKVTSEESDAYFATRPRRSQLGAWASHQSTEISGRPALEQALAEIETRFSSGDVPRPPHWGGYRITPQSIEFWQGRRNRLHDRLEYVRTGDTWRVRRLSP